MLTTETNISIQIFFFFFFLGGGGGRGVLNQSNISILHNNKLLFNQDLLHYWKRPTEIQNTHLN